MSALPIADPPGGGIVYLFLSPPKGGREIKPRRRPAERAKTEKKSTKNRRFCHSRSASFQPVPLFVPFLERNRNGTSRNHCHHTPKHSNIQPTVPETKAHRPASTFCTPLYFHQRCEGSFALPGYDETHHRATVLPNCLPHPLRLFFTRFRQLQRTAILDHQLVFFKTLHAAIHLALGLLTIPAAGRGPLCIR